MPGVDPGEPARAGTTTARRRHRRRSTSRGTGPTPGRTPTPEPLLRRRGGSGMSQNPLARRGPQGGYPPSRRPRGGYPQQGGRLPPQRQGVPSNPVGTRPAGWLPPRAGTRRRGATSRRACRTVTGAAAAGRLRPARRAARRGWWLPAGRRAGRPEEHRPDHRHRRGRRRAAGGGRRHHHGAPGRRRRAASGPSPQLGSADRAPTTEPDGPADDRAVEPPATPADTSHAGPGGKAIDLGNGVKLTPAAAGRSAESRRVPLSWQRPEHLRRASSRPADSNPGQTCDAWHRDIAKEYTNGKFADPKKADLGTKKLSAATCQAQVTVANGQRRSR